MSRGILAFAAGMGQGYLNQDRYMEEKARQDAADKRAQESHDMQMTEARQRQADQAALRAAGQDVTVMQDPGDADQAQSGIPRSFYAGGRAYDSADAANAAAAAANTPEGRIARQSAALAGIGNYAGAQALKTGAVQQKAAQFTLDKGMEEWANQQFDQKLAHITTPEQLATVLSGSPIVDGKEITLVKSADGKTSQMTVPGPDGNPVAFGKPISNDPKEMQKALIEYSKSMTMPQRITAIQHMQDLEERATQHLETVRHNKAIEANSSAQLGISAGHLALANKEFKAREDARQADLKNDPLRNLTGAEKVLVGSYSKQADAIEAALNKAELEPGFDPNSPAVASLKARKLNLENQRTQILKKYIPELGAVPAYPTSASPAKPGSVGAAPAGSISRDASGNWVATPTQPTPAAAASGVKAAAAPPPMNGDWPADPNARAGTSPRLVQQRQAQQDQQAAQAIADRDAAAGAAAQAKTAQDAYRVIDMPGFNNLPPDEQQRMIAMTK